MSSGKTRLVFFGNERLVSGLATSDTPVLRMLISQGYDIAAVVAHHSDTRSRNGRPLEIARVAAEHSIPLLTPNKPLDIYDKLAAMDAQAAVLVAYGRIIPQKLIDLFPRGIINIHPSMLPKYRGPTPIESPLLAGDSQSGVSIMALTAEMDAGPIYAQAAFDIEPTDTKFDLYHKAANLSSKLLEQSLPSILDGTLSPTTQDDSAATYSQLIDKSDGHIDWSQSATQIERSIRAYLGWPQSRATFGSVDVIITAAHVVDGSGEPGSVTVREGQLVVATPNGSLVIDHLKPAGKGEMPASSFLAGYGDRILN